MVCGCGCGCGSTLPLRPPAPRAAMLGGRRGGCGCGDGGGALPLAPPTPRTVVLRGGRAWRGRGHRIEGGPMRVRSIRWGDNTHTTSRPCGHRCVSPRSATLPRRRGTWLVPALMGACPDRCLLPALRADVRGSHSAQGTPWTPPTSPTSGVSTIGCLRARARKRSVRAHASFWEGDMRAGRLTFLRCSSSVEGTCGGAECREGPSTLSGS